MLLYEKVTDGGAQYYCLKPVKGTNVGDISTAVFRTDGGEIEANISVLEQHGVNLVIKR